MKKRLFTILLISLSMLLLFTGCGGGGSSGDTTPEDTTPPAVPVDPITLVADGATSYRILYAEGANSAIVNACLSIRTAFMEATGVEILPSDEALFEIYGGTVAIVVGEISDEVTPRLKADLQYDDFVIHVENNNLYILGGSQDATVAAVEWFVGTYLSAPTERITLEGDLDMRYIHEYALTELTIAGNPISAYQIVYDNTLQYSKARANDIRNLIVRYTGVMLDVVPDNGTATENEIVVGVGLRDESKAVAATFDAPNINYSIRISGNKLLIVNEGVRTGEAAVSAFEAFMETLTKENCALTADNVRINGNIRNTADPKALARYEGTDLRLMHSNVLLSESVANNYTPQQRAELLVDTYLIYSPDIITFNEMIEGRAITSYIRIMLAEYYTFVDADYLELFEDPETMDANLKARNYATPIAYRKDAGLTPLKSGFSYLSDMISYHGAAWTVFEMENGNRFVALSAHFSENKDADGKWITTFAEDTIRILNVARKEYGDLPVVMNGDWFAWQKTAPYLYFTELGFVDASETAIKQHSVGIGTFHDVGVGETGRAEEDIVFINPGWFTALAHKNLVDFYTVNGSDHYPVLVDIRFNRSATADDIDPFDDGTGSLNVKDEGAGGSGEWGTDAVPKA